MKRTYRMDGKSGCKGDPRMNRAVEARLKNPKLSLYHALRTGGFDYTSTSNSCKSPEDNITLGQRKNQLNRRLRLAREQAKVAGRGQKTCLEEDESTSSASSYSNHPLYRVSTQHPNQSPLVESPGSVLQNNPRCATRSAIHRAYKEGSDPWSHIGADDFGFSRIAPSSSGNLSVAQNAAVCVLSGVESPEFAAPSASQPTTNTDTAPERRLAKLQEHCLQIEPNEPIKDVGKKVAPLLQLHRDSVATNQALFWERGAEGQLSSIDEHSTQGSAHPSTSHRQQPATSLSNQKQAAQYSATALPSAVVQPFNPFFRRNSIPFQTQEGHSPRSNHYVTNGQGQALSQAPQLHSSQNEARASADLLFFHEPLVKARQHHHEALGSHAPVANLLPHHASSAGLANGREELALRYFQDGLKDLYRRSMQTAGYSAEESHESSHYYQRVAFFAWKNECERLQSVLGDFTLENSSL